MTLKHNQPQHFDDVDFFGEVKFDGGADQKSNLKAAVGGVAAGYKIARGKVTPTAADEDVVTGLDTVVAVVASLSGAPTLTHMFVSADVGDQAGTPAAGSFTLRSRKPTSAADVTPVNASSPFGEVEWIAIGT